MKYLLRALVVLLVLVAGWQAYLQLAEGLPVEVAMVRYGPIQEFVDEEGKTRLPRTHLITMPYTGRIAHIDLEEGMPVREGQVVAHLVPIDLKLELESAQAAVERLAAQIRENDDTSIEETALQQALSYVTSMDLTVEAAKNRQESGKAKYELAKKNFLRMQELHERGTVTEEQLNRAEVELVSANVDYQQDILLHRALQAVQTATALLPTTIRQYISRKELSTEVLEKEQTQAESELAQVKQNQQRGTMHSPVDGVVLHREVFNERYLTAGTVLLEIGRLEELEVEADVLSQDVVDIRLGDAVEVYGPAIGPQPVTGRVSRIYPAGFTKVSSLGVEQQRVKVIIQFDSGVLESLQEARKLGVGFRLDVRIFTDTRERTLLVPRSALFRGAGGGWQVFVVREGQARLVSVQTGLMNDEVVEVVSGLQDGEQVVLAPEATLQDATAVRPVTESAGPADKD